MLLYQQFCIHSNRVQTGATLEHMKIRSSIFKSDITDPYRCLMLVPQSALYAFPLEPQVPHATPQTRGRCIQAFSRTEQQFLKSTQTIFVQTMQLNERKRSVHNELILVIPFTLKFFILVALTSLPLSLSLYLRMSC